MRTEIKINKADLDRSALEKITQVFSDALRKWREEEPIRMKGDKLFYCQTCSRTAAETYYMVKKYVRINTNNMLKPLPYDNLPTVLPKYFGGIEIKMAAEELRDFVRSYGEL